jgi:hypothetical protein
MNAPARPREITLDDKYTLPSGRAFMTGTQALVRLPTTRCGARKRISRKTISASSPA